MAITKELLDGKLVSDSEDVLQLKKELTNETEVSNLFPTVT